MKGLKNRHEEDPLRRDLELAVHKLLKKEKRIAVKLRVKPADMKEALKKDFEYCRKLTSLITSIEYVEWAYDWLSNENPIPSALALVKNCLQELCGILNETLAEKGSHE